MKYPALGRSGFLAFAVAEKHSGPTAVVLTGADKFFCNGLDIEVLASRPKELLLSFHSSKFLVVSTCKGIVEYGPKRFV